MAKTPEQKQASKARKNQIYITALIVAKDLFAQADIVFVYSAMDTHFHRLGSKTPQDKMMYLDVKMEVLKFLGDKVAPLKRKSEQKACIEQEIEARSRG